MKNKTKSCERCILKKVIPDENPQPKNIQIVSPAYMTKKIKQLHTQNRKWMEKRKKLAQERKKLFQQKEIQQCTFQPQINPNTSDFYIPKDPFIKRQRQWKKGIEKKKTKERQMKEKQQQKKLTFKPKISKTPNSAKDLTKQLTYSNKSRLSQRTYRDIYEDKQQVKQNLKYTIKQPFQHRRVRSMADEYIEMNRSDNVKKIESEDLKNPEEFLSLKGLLVRKVQEKEEVVQVSKETKGEKEEEQI